MKRHDVVESFKQRCGALSLFVFLFGLLAGISLLRRQLLENLQSSPLTYYGVQNLSATACILAILLTLTRYRIRWTPGHDAVSLLFGMILGSVAMMLAQAPRWIAVDPTVSFSDPAADVLLIVAIAICVAVWEELLFRRLYDGAFSAIFGPLLGGTLQVAIFVLAHNPFADALVFPSVMDRAMFAIVATQLARSKLGLASAVGVHVAFNAMLWIGFGAHSAISKIHGVNPLIGVIGMPTDAVSPAFAFIAAVIGLVWFKRRDFWDRPDWFHFRWNLLVPRRQSASA